MMNDRLMEHMILCKRLYIYIYICVCVCVCVLIYVYIHIYALLFNLTDLSYWCLFSAKLGKAITTQTWTGR
jgi:hypothetical protein